MRILSFRVCSIFEFSACERMNDTTNLAVVDLSPYGFVFKELALQTLIFNEFLSFFFFFFVFVLQIILHTAEIILHNWFLRGVLPPLKTGDDIDLLKSRSGEII